MTNEQKALREAVALALYNKYRARCSMQPVDYIGANETAACNQCREDADAAIAVALERAAKVAETVGPVVIQDNGDGSRIVNTWRANEIAAAIRALIKEK